MLLLCFLLFCLLLENQLTGEVAKTPSNISTPFVFVVSPKLNQGKKSYKERSFKSKSELIAHNIPGLLLQNKNPLIQISGNC